MAKSLVLGNNQMMIALDQFGQVYDLYYPYIGLENHTKWNFVHRIGIWVDNSFRWLDDGSWKISIDYKKGTMVSDVIAINEEIGIKLLFNDAIYNEKNVFIREVRVTNLFSRNRSVKLYFNQQFIIYESIGGDTVLYDHEQKAVIHYKGRRVFLIDARVNGNSFDEYSVGLLGIEGREGTYKDAEDGKLEKNNVEHGLVDSVIGVYFNIEANQSQLVEYWLVAAKSIPEAKELDNLVKKEKEPKAIVESTGNYWKAWLNKNNINFQGLDEKYVDLFNESLLVVSCHSGGNGEVIASGDSDLLKQGRDTYSYVWARDGALTVISMMKAGYNGIARRFLEFSEKTITEDGFMLHKYRSDGTLGSSWHPWVRNCKSELPIQEDETALVVIALWKYYEATRALEFIEEVYNTLIKKPCEFMTTYIDEKTGLPRPTYDLWEEKFGISTFTSATVYGAQISAAKIAGLLGKTRDSEHYINTAKKIKQAILLHLYDAEKGYFIKQISYLTDGYVHRDETVDISSVYGLYEFGVLDIEDEKLSKSIQMVEQKVQNPGDVGGIGRYENDYYFRVSQNTPGNPWIITSLWLARYYLKKAKKKEELQVVYLWLDWVLKYAQPSGILSEQLNPFTGEQLSATPLTWSHAEYVHTIIELLEKNKELEKAPPN
jgi:GH15 family glucan-1,4-alpha-glucosidase